MERGTTKKSSGRRRNISYSRYGYFFIIPFFLVYIIFSLTPLFSTFGYSMTNMGSRNSAFFGFSDTEVFYDQHLDLKDYYSTDFEGDTGLTKTEYTYIKNYFALQKIITLQDPFNAEGMQAIVTLTDISDATRASVQAYIDTKDPTAITPEAMKELEVYYSSYSALDKNVMDALPGVSAAVQLITDNGVAEEPEVITTASEDVIAQIPAIIDELNTLKDAEITEENRTSVMAVEYYATKLNGEQAPANAFDYLIEYYQSFVDETSTLHDYDLYTTSKGLFKSDAITTDITTDLATLLTQDWIDTITNLSSIDIDSLKKYADAQQDLNNSQLLKDLITLNDAGIIDANVLIEKDGVLVIDPDSGLISDLSKLITTNFTSDPNEIRAVTHIRNLSAYVSNTAIKAGLNNLDPIKASGGIDSYMNFAGSREVDVDKYLDYKADVGLTEKLSLSRYLEMDAAKKSKYVAKFEAVLAENQAMLPEAQAAYDVVKASYDTAKSTYDAIKKPTDADQAAFDEATDAMDAAEESLAKVTVTGISVSQRKIDSPKGLLTEADYKVNFLYVGLDNYKSIFTEEGRFNNVFGSLWNTILLWLMNYIPQILLALLLSSWMTDNRLNLKGKATMKALVYMPSLMTAATIAMFFWRSFQFSTSLESKAMAQQVLKIFGDPDGFNFFAKPWPKRTVIAFVNFWQWYGNTMILLIAGISSVSISLFESAQIDGATSGQIFRKITLPMIRPIMLYTLVISLIGGLQMYDIPKLMGNGAPLADFRGTSINSTQTILMYIQNQAYGPAATNKVGLAAAVSVVLFVFTSVCSGILFYVMRDKEAGRLRKLAKKGGDVK